MSQIWLLCSVSQGVVRSEAWTFLCPSSLLPSAVPLLQLSGGPPPRQLRPVPLLHHLCCLHCPESLLTSCSASSSLPLPADGPLTHGAARVILLRYTSSQLTKFHWVPIALRRKPTVWGIGAQGSAWSRMCLPHQLIWDFSIPLSTHGMLVSPQWVMQGCYLHPGTRPPAALPHGQQVRAGQISAHPPLSQFPAPNSGPQGSTSLTAPPYPETGSSFFRPQEKGQ